MSEPSATVAARRAAAGGWDAQAVAEWTLLAMITFVMLAPLLTGDIHLVAGESQGSGGSGNLLRQGFYVVVFALSLLAADVARFPERLLAPPTSVLAMLAWCLVTVPLAIDPGVSARRLLLTVMVAFSIFLLVQRAGYARSVAVVRRIAPAILLANYAAVLALPGFAIHHATTAIDPSIVGAWRGVLMQKNVAGLFSAYTILFFALGGGRLRPAFRLAVVLAAAYFLYRTRSKTSMGFTVASLAAAALFTRYNPYYRAVALVFLLLAAVFAGMGAWLNWASLTAPFQDEMFLTGRVQIWPPLFDFWRDHPHTGSGYGSFWDVGGAQPIAQYVPALPWKAWILDLTSGHNGYIDLLVQTGWPGFALGILATIVAPFWKFLTSLTLDRAHGSLLLACLIFSICHNLTESSVFDRDSPVQVFLMLTLALLSVEGEPRPTGSATATDTPDHADG